MLSAEILRFHAYMQLEGMCRVLYHMDPSHLVHQWMWTNTIEEGHSDSPSEWVCYKPCTWVQDSYVLVIASYIRVHWHLPLWIWLKWASSCDLSSNTTVHFLLLWSMRLIFAKYTIPSVHFTSTSSPTWKAKSVPWKDEAWRPVLFLALPLIILFAS